MNVYRYMYICIYSYSERLLDPVIKTLSILYNLVPAPNTVFFVKIVQTRAENITKEY